MATQAQDVFLYGLHMDPERLRTRGLDPGTPRRAHVDGFALHLGERPTVVPCAGGRVHGMVYSLGTESLRRLYALPEVEAYRPEGVLAWIEGDAPRPALCFRLARMPATDERNAEYARRLQETLGRLGFPPDSIAAVAGLAAID
jgi:gamma-glutamylcyclotransferase (GGCT)/AIG2-like uncharacterized protein YtfP